MVPLPHQTALVSLQTSPVPLQAGLFAPPLLLVAFGVVAVGFGLLLVALVRAEARDTERTDRASGERMARRDTRERR